MSELLSKRKSGRTSASEALERTSSDRTSVPRLVPEGQVEGHLQVEIDRDQVKIHLREEVALEVWAHEEELHREQESEQTLPPRDFGCDPGYHARVAHPLGVLLVEDDGEPDLVVHVWPLTRDV